MSHLYTGEFKPFKDALLSLKPAVQAKPTLPILGHVLIEADQTNTTLVLRATTLTLGARKRLYGGQIGTGAIALPFKTLVATLPTLFKDGEFTITVDDATLKATFTQKERSYTVPGMAAAEFPDWPDLTSFLTLTSLPHSRLYRALKMVEDGAATEVNRPVLQGVFLEFQSDLLALTTADGYRLHHARIQLPVGSGVRSTLPDLTVLMDAMEILNGLNPVTLSLKRDVHEYTRYKPWPSNHEQETYQTTSDQLLLSQDSVEVTLVCIEGKFPDYQAIIPRHDPIFHALIDPLTIIEACKAVAHVAKQSADTVKLSDFGQGECTLHTKAQELGEIKIKLPAVLPLDHVPNVDLHRFAYNYTYLADAAKVIRDMKLETSIRFEFHGRTDPMVMRPLDLPTGVADLIIVVMPISTRWD